MEFMMKNVLLTSIGILAAASSAMGGEVTATKRSPIMTPIENAYGTIEVRQISKSDKAADGTRSNRVSSYRLVPRLGTTVFNDRLNLYAQFPVENVVKTSTITKTKSDYAAIFSAVQAEHYSITPFVKGLLPSDQNRFDAVLAVTFDLASSVDTGIGALSFHGALEPEMATGTKSKDDVDAKVISNGQYSLAEDGAPATQKVTPQEPTPTMEYAAGASFTPSIAPKLSLTVDLYVDREFAAAYVVREDDEGSRQEKTGYKITNTSLTDIVLAYKADSLTTIQSLSRIRQDGVMATAPRIEQRLSLIHKMF
jgi:hypothetical protein